MKIDPLYKLLIIYIASIIGILGAMYILTMVTGCTTVKPVPDTRPSYYQLAKQAEQMTNSKQ